jgi:hypothetical protein
MLDIMSDDPFQRFERSRGGLLIPLCLFVLGAVPTALAIDAINKLPEDVRQAPQEVDRVVPQEQADLDQSE